MEMVQENDVRPPRACGVGLIGLIAALATWKEVAMGCESFDDAVSASHAATDRIMRGDAGGFKDLYSRRGDITLGNPFGGFGRGWDGVVEQLERAASYFSDGRAIDFETIATTAGEEFAYTVEI